MKIKFLIIPAVLVLIIAFASCKKNSTTNTITKFDTVNNIVTVKDTVTTNTSDTVKILDTATNNVADTITGFANGTAFTANLDPLFQSYINSGLNFEITAEDVPGNNYYIFVSTTDTAITAKTYGTPGDVTSSASIEIYYSGVGYYYNTSTSGTITITSIVGGIVKGTFSGTIYPNGDNTQTGIVITNGQFTSALL